MQFGTIHIKNDFNAFNACNNNCNYITLFRLVYTAYLQVVPLCIKLDWLKQPCLWFIAVKAGHFISNECFGLSGLFFICSS